MDDVLFWIDTSYGNAPNVPKRHETLLFEMTENNVFFVCVIKEYLKHFQYECKILVLKNKRNKLA